LAEKPDRRRVVACFKIMIIAEAKLKAAIEK